MPKPSISQAFASVLKEHRLAQGHSQEALAEKANLHPNHVGLVERGFRKPSLEVADALATALGKPLSVFLHECERKRGGRT